MHTLPVSSSLPHNEVIVQVCYFINLVYIFVLNNVIQYVIGIKIQAEEP